MKLPNACWAIFAAVPLIFFTPEYAPAQTNIFSEITTGKKTRVESRATHKDKDIDIGWAYKDRHTVSFKLKTDPNFILHLSDDDIEAKIKKETDSKVYVFGAGDEGLFSVGFQQGRLKRHGFGVGVVYNNEPELRGQVWTGNEKTFVGFRKSEGKLYTIISRFEDGVTYKIYNKTDFDEFNLIEFTVAGKPREGYYGYGFKNMYYHLNDSALFGNSSIKMKDDNAFKYFLPPLAWSVKNFGVNIEHKKDEEGSGVEVEAIKYVSDSNWVGVEYEKEEKSSLGVIFGKTHDRFKLGLGLGYGGGIKGTLVFEIGF